MGKIVIIQINLQPFCVFSGRRLSAIFYVSFGLALNFPFGCALFCGRVCALIEL